MPRAILAYLTISEPSIEGEKIKIEGGNEINMDSIVRIIKVHIPIEGMDVESIIKELEEIAGKYGKKIEIDEIKNLVKNRFGVG